MSKKLRVDLQTADGKVVAFHTYTAADEPFNIAAMIPDGYLLAGGQQLVTKLPAEQEQVTYLLRHRMVMVTADDPKRAGELIEGTTAKLYPHGVDKADLQRTVKRSITVKSATGLFLQQAENHITFTRDAQIDVVTGEVAYLPWSYNGKAILPGFMAQPHDGEIIEAVPAVEVTPDSEDLVVTIQYQKAPVQIKITYRDAMSDKVVAVDNHPQVKDETVKLLAPKGYALNTASDQLKIGTARKQAYEVLVHQV